MDAPVFINGLCCDPFVEIGYAGFARSYEM
jgi:hypothetical protein